MLSHPRSIDDELSHLFGKILAQVEKKNQRQQKLFVRCTPRVFARRANILGAITLLFRWICLTRATEFAEKERLFIVCVINTIVKLSVH